MNRQFALYRDREYEGSDRSLQLATALAQVADPEFLEKLLHVKSSLDAFGGEAFISAQRVPIDPATGKKVDHNTPGREYVTMAYAISYRHRATKIKNQVAQPDDPGEVEALEVGTENGTEPSEEPEPAEVS